MIEYSVDRISRHSAPPTRESIEQVRIEQMEAVRRIRQMLLELQPVNSAA